MLNPYGRQINPGPGQVSLGSFAGKDMRLVNPGPGPMPQQGLPGNGGGLARLMQMYGRPGGPRRPFHTGQF